MDWRYTDDKDVAQARRVIARSTAPGGRARWVLYVIGAAAAIGFLATSFL